MMKKIASLLNDFQRSDYCEFYVPFSVLDGIYTLHTPMCFVCLLLAFSVFLVWDLSQPLAQRNDKEYNKFAHIPFS